MDLTCKLYNRNSFDHKEMFQGKELFIAANSYTVMDYDAAQAFLGQFTPVVTRKDGTTDPRFHKRLEIDKDDARRCEMALRNESEEKATKVFVCQSCLKEFSSKSSLLKHVKNNHIGQIVDKDSREDVEDQDE